MTQLKSDINDLRGTLTFRRSSPKPNPDASLKALQHGSTQDKLIQAFTLKDYNWSEFYDETKDMGENSSKPQIPKLILTEFQPIKDFQWEKIVASLASTAAEKVAGIAGSIPVIGEQAKTIAATTIGNAFVEKNYQYFSKNIDNVTEDISMIFIRQLMSGKYLNSFELPFFLNDYIRADTTDSWSIGGSEKMLGDSLNTLLQDFFSVNFPMAPVWSKGNDVGYDFSYEFHLINNNNENLKKNFQFLHALCSGAFWVQLGLMQQPPNLYDIEVVGRFHRYFCALGVIVEYVGKTRTLSSSAFDRIKSGLDGFCCNYDEMLFPDGYKVTLNVKDLTPNNFNVYVEYLMGKYDKTNVTSVKAIKRVNVADWLAAADRAGAGEAVPDYLRKVINKSIDVGNIITKATGVAGSNIANQVKEGLGQYTSSVKNKKSK